MGSIVCVVSACTAQALQCARTSVMGLETCHAPKLDVDCINTTHTLYTYHGPSCYALWGCQKDACLILSGHQASLLVPLLSIHDIIDDVCLRLHNAVNDSVLDCVFGLHV